MHEQQISNLKSCFAISLKPEIITAFLETSIFSESDSGLSDITLLCHFTAMCSACKVQTVNEYFFFHPDINLLV